MLKDWSPRRADIAIAVGLGVFVLAITSVTAFRQNLSVSPTGYVLLSVPAVALLWRRRFPLAVLLVVLPAVWTYYGVGYPGGPAALYAVVALYTLARHRGPLVAGVAAGAVFLVGVGVTFIASDLRLPVDGRLGFALGWSGMAIAAGAAVNARTSSLAARREQAEERARRLAEEERLSIAREVHDVVAHSLAMINVQAGVGAHVADRRPERAKEALLAIKEASHTALADLRATLAVLRSGEDLAPAPSIRRLADLTEATTAAGLRVEVEGEPGELPAPVDTAAYRIVQESLTNAVRHAEDATEITVRFTREPGDLEILVRDNGLGSVDPGSGNGLRGMRERAEALGGKLTAGPQAPDGGYQVRVVLPVRGVDE